MSPFEHQTVLLEEAVTLLKPGAGRLIVDGTLGGGGHSQALLAAGATVIGLDRDERALSAAKQRLAPYAERFTALQGNFAEALQLAQSQGHEQVDGLLLDLGVSSPQLDEAARGFSFQNDGPLDMRMGAEGETAAELIDRSTEGELEQLIRTLGEERFARPIARELKARKPATTLQAVEAIKRAVPRKAWPDKIHVATRTFQALRMAVNGELEALQAAVSSLPTLLRKGGVAAIITFHSLEDRLVKQAFRALEGRCTCPPGLPVCACGATGSFDVLTKKAITASEAEVKKNPRARSAKLRAVEKVR